MKPPARAATVLAVFLVICTAIVAVDFWLDPAQPDVGSPKAITWITVNVLLLILTPAATYYLVHLWLEGDVSQYPDVDEAWDAGIAALAEHGIELTDLPLYVILGVPNEAAADSLLAAARITTVVTGVPKGAAPLHWYSSEQAIYLVCMGLGRLGRLSQLASMSAGYARSGVAAANPMAATMVAGAPGGGSSYPTVAMPFEALGRGDQSPIMGTLMASPGEWVKLDPAATAPAAAASSSGMSRKEAADQTARLRYTFSRLRRLRQPYCANNGVLTVLPHPVLTDVVFAKEVPEAVRADLAAARDATRIASPVTMLVTGMEGEEGFSELVRRVGLERARSSRFGKGFDVWNVASDENMDALSLHACGSFEDWVYTLFAADEGTEQRSNGKLFAMLCRVRRHLQPRLRGVLVNGYAVETETNGDPPRLFSGCYFAATGRQGEQQAFVRSVFDKLDQLAEDLQWNDDALREEAAYRWMARLLTAANAVMLIAIGFLIYKYIADKF